VLSCLISILKVWINPTVIVLDEIVNCNNTEQRKRFTNGRERMGDVEKSNL
jgi:hypothetical protein